MNFIQFKNSLKNFAVFSSADIRLLDPGFHRRRLNEWQEKGYIRKIIKGFYIFSDTHIDELMLFHIAGRIYKPSYVSFETALSFYNFIPEAVYGITSASTKKTSSFSTPVAKFSYRTLNSSLFFGYDIKLHFSRTVKIANPPKALLDYLYLHPEIIQKDHFSELRINLDELFKEISEETLFSTLERFKNRALTGRTKKLWRYLNNA